MTNEAELLARLERADGPDRKLDGAIYWTVFEENRTERPLWWVELQFSTSPENGDWRKPYTGSIDAALALTDHIIPGADVDLEMREMMTDGVVKRVTDATVYGRAYSNEPNAKAYANSPALALCIAALKASAALPKARSPQEVSK